MDGPETLPGPD